MNDDYDEFLAVIGPFDDKTPYLKNFTDKDIPVMLLQKQAIYKVLEQMQEPMVGVNEMQEILFVNSAAANLLNLKNEISSQSADELMAANDLVRSLTETNPSKPIKLTLNEKDA